MRIPRPISLAVLAGLSSLTARGQDVVADSLSNDSIAAQRKHEIDNFPANVNFGRLKLNLSQSIALEYNDNVRLSDVHREEDEIFRPIFSLNALYPVSEINTLRFTCGIGYEKFFNYSTYDRLVIDPGSSLDFDLYFGSYKLNLHDRFSYDLDAGKLAAISGSANYGGFDNTLGASLQGSFKRTITTIGYDFDKFISAEKQFDYISRSTHTASARGGFIVAPELTAGLEAQASPTYYDQNLVNNNVGYSVGAYADWQVGEELTIEPRGGYSYYTFSDSILFHHLPNLGSYYFGLNVKHQIRPRIGYSLDAGHDTHNGPYGNIEDLYHVAWNWDLRVIDNVHVFTGLTYQLGNDKYGTLSDDFTRWIFNIGASRKLSDKLTVRLDYRLMLKDSAFRDRKYSQDRVTLNVTYRF